jgi:Tat protein translocase TatB subunit
VFGSIGGPEVILLFIVALLLFGPRRLPEIGRTLGKTVADFRRATNEFKMNLEREVQIEAIKDTLRPIEAAPPPAVLARSVVLRGIDPADPTEPEAPAPPAGTSGIDGGPDSVH